MPNLKVNSLRCAIIAELLIICVSDIIHLITAHFGLTLFHALIAIASQPLILGNMLAKHMTSFVNLANKLSAL